MDAPRADMHLCREAASPPLSEIVKLLKKQPQAIEPGLIAVDGDLFIPSVGEIDLVALSRNQLVMISTFVDLTAHHLGRAAGIKQWVKENANMLARAYSKAGLRDKFTVRILFLCAEIDPQAQLLMSLIADLPLEVFQYRCLESAQTRWLTVERIAIDKKPAPQLRNVVISPPRLPNISIKPESLLTNEEIGEFFEDELSAETDQEFGDIISVDETTFSGPYFNS